MGRVTLSPEEIKAVDNYHGQYDDVVGERDTLTRRRDSLPKLKHNTRKKLARKRSEDRLAFQMKVAGKRSIRGGA